MPVILASDMMMASIVFAYVFGSIDTPRQTPRSDVDVAIYAAGTADRDDLRLRVAAVASTHLRTD